MKQVVLACINDGDVGRVVDHYARKLAGRFPHVFDLDDGRQELWTAIVDRLNRDDNYQSITYVAMSAARSKYGTILKGRLRNSEINHTYSSAFMDVYLNVNGEMDRSIERVDARHLLDTVRNHKRMTGKHRLVFDRYREGKTGPEIADELNLSPSRIRRIKQEIVTIASTIA